MPNIGMSNTTGKGPYATADDANWKASLAVNDGDLIYRDPNDTNSAGMPYDKSAANFTWTTNLLDTQEAFKADFIGVSTVRRTTLQTTDGSITADGPILIRGEFTFPCAALGSAALVGAYVAPAQGTGNTLSSTNVAIVANVSGAIGRVSRFAPVGSTYLTFWVDTVLIDSGVQAQA